LAESPNRHDTTAKYAHASAVHAECIVLHTQQGSFNLHFHYITGQILELPFEILRWKFLKEYEHTQILAATLKVARRTLLNKPEGKI
jgi:hypothetical protein